MIARRSVMALCAMATVVLTGCPFYDGIDGGEPETKPEPPAATNQVTPSGSANGEIAFSFNDDIYVVNSDGSDLRRLTQTADEELAPSIAPSGDRLYFRCKAGNSICVLTPGGAPSVVVTPERFPAWPQPSPDGTKLVFSAGHNLNGNFTSDIYIHDLASGSTTALMGPDQTDINEESPTWTPDGRVVWERANDIVVMRPGASAPTTILDFDRDPPGSRLHPTTYDVSPDGSQIAFAAGPEYVPGADLQDNDIYVIDIDGTDMRRLTDTDSFDETNPRWSPDGSQLAYSRHEIIPREAPQEDIRVMNADGTGDRAVFDPPKDGLFPIFDWGDLKTSITVGSVSLPEDDEHFTFEISLSAPSTQSITVLYKTVDGSAKVADDDYDAKATDALIFAPGETSKTVTVEVDADERVESNETFYLELSNPSGGAVLARTRGRGLIINDDDAPSPTPSSPSPSPSTSTPAPTLSGRIAFISEANGYHQLFTMDPDGSDVEHVSTNQASSNLGDPSWSSNGTKIIHTALDGSQHELITRTAAPNGAFDPILHPSDDVEPAFRGGSTTEYWWSSNEHGDYDLFRGPGRNHMTTSASDERDVSFGNDPLKFVYEANYDGDYDIYLQALSESGANLSGAPVNLTQESGAAFADTDPDMSADGTKVVFSSNRTGGGDIYVVDVATKAVTRITSDPAAETQPTFSPNGTQIAFVREVGGDTEIFRINAQAGSTAVNISNNPGGPDISPDWGAAPSSPRPVPTGSTALSVVVPLGLTFGVGLERARRRRSR